MQPMPLPISHFPSREPFIVPLEFVGGKKQEGTMSGEKVVGQQFWIIYLLSELDSTEILARSPENLKRGRYQGLSPNWIELEKRHQL
jgi:hypothetical protein